MSQPTLLTVRDFVRDYIPDVPIAKLVRKLNVILEEVFEEIAQIEWSTVTTKAQVTTGAVNAANGSTAVTFSSAVLTFPNTDSLILVQIAGSNAWYTVTPSSTTVGALSSAFEGVTGAALTFTIVYPVVVFPAAVGEVLSMQRLGYPMLAYAQRENAPFRLQMEIIGQPLYYGPYLFDATATPDDAHRLLLTPFPDATYTYNYSYLKRPTLLAITDATTTKLAIPSSFARAVEFGTLALCWSQEDGGVRFGEWWGRYQKALQQTRANANTSVTPRIKSAREAMRGGVYAIQYPPA